MSEQHCARCRRPAPSQDSSEFVEWEALGDEGDQVVCPGCLTGAEEQALVESVPGGGDKVRENRLRRMAERQGLRLEKSRRRDPRAYDFGTYQLVNERTNTIEAGDRQSGYGLSLDDVETALTS